MVTETSPEQVYEDMFLTDFQDFWDMIIQPSSLLSANCTHSYDSAINMKIHDIVPFHELQARKQI